MLFSSKECKEKYGNYYQINKNHLFSFPESGWFFALVEAPAPSPVRTAIVLGNTENLWLRDCKSQLLDKGTSPPGWAAIRSLDAVLGSIILFIKLRQQHIHMGSGKVIEECFLGFLGQFFL